MRWDARGTIGTPRVRPGGRDRGSDRGLHHGHVAAVERRPDDTTPSSSPAPRARPTTRSASTCPLENLDCTGETILVVGLRRDERRPQQRGPANTDADVKYLETAESCNTLYGAEKQDRADVRRLPRPLRQPQRAVLAADERRPQERRGHQPQARREDPRPVPVRAATRPTSPTLAVGMRRRHPGRHLHPRPPAAAGRHRPNHARPRSPATYDPQTDATVVSRHPEAQRASIVDRSGIVEKLTWQAGRDRRLRRLRLLSPRPPGLRGSSPRSSLTTSRPHSRCSTSSSPASSSCEDPGRAGGGVDGQRHVVGHLGPPLLAVVQAGEQVLAGQPAQREQHERVGVDQPGDLVGRGQRVRARVDPGGAGARGLQLAAEGQQLDPGLLGVLDQRVRQLAREQRRQPAGSRRRPPRRTRPVRARRAPAGWCRSTRARRRPRRPRGNGPVVTVIAPTDPARASERAALRSAVAVRRLLGRADPRLAPPRAGPGRPAPRPDPRVRHPAGAAGPPSVIGPRPQGDQVAQLVVAELGQGRLAAGEHRVGQRALAGRAARRSAPRWCRG